MHRIVLLLSTVLLVSADLDGCELVVDQHAQNFDRFIASSASSTEGLNSFHLHTNDCTDTANNKRLVVSHSPSRKGPCTTKYTPCGLLDHRNIEYFDRHTLDCGSGQVMTEYKLERCDADNMRFRYVCCEYYEERGPTMLRHTDCDEVQGKRLEYLDRHPVACPYPAVLSHFQMLSWEQTCVGMIIIQNLPSFGQICHFCFSPQMSATTVAAPILEGTDVSGTHASLPLLEVWSATPCL